MKRKTVELAAQIVFEYPQWGWEHINDTLATYEDGDAPCDGNELEDACYAIMRCKDKEGLDFEQAVEAVLKGVEDG